MKRRPTRRTRRIKPADAPSEAVERIAPRRELQLHDGDVVIVREIVGTQGARYRLRIHPEAHRDLVFSSFAQAAVEGELLATRLVTRLMLVEDDVPSLLSDQRQHG